MDGLIKAALIGSAVVLFIFYMEGVNDRLDRMDDRLRELEVKIVVIQQMFEEGKEEFRRWRDEQQSE